MKKIFKYILIGLVYLLGIAMIIAFSPIILLVFFFQLITQPFEKKKFYSSGFDKYTAYTYGITHTSSYHIFQSIKQHKFNLIVSAFAGLDLYIFETEAELNFVLSSDFDEDFYFSPSDNDWVYYPQHGDNKNANGEEKDFLLPFEEMRIIKEQRYPDSEKPVHYYICADKELAKSFTSKKDKIRFRQDSRFIPLFKVTSLVNQTAELDAKEKPLPPLSPDAIYTIWSNDKNCFCEVFQHSPGVFVYRAMAIDYDEYSEKYYWAPTGRGFASFFDTAEKAKQYAEDFLHGK